MIIHWPGLTDKGTEYEGLIYNVDLPPTVLDLLGIDVPENWDGESLAPVLKGEKEFEGRDHLVLGTGNFSYQRAVRTDRYRLIRTIHPGLLPYDPLYLFDMENDPHQRNNIANEKPEVVAELDHLMFDWLWRHTTGPAGVRDPFQEQLRAGFDPDMYCSRQHLEQHLIDTGRKEDLADLRRRRDQKPPLRPW